MAAESSRLCRSRSSTQKRELLCGHGERPVLRISGTRNNSGRRFWECVYYKIKEECDFFRWTDPEAENEDPHIARMKRKVAALKAKLMDIEWKFKVAAVLGTVGWVVLLLVADLVQLEAEDSMCDAVEVWLMKLGENLGFNLDLFECV